MMKRMLIKADCKVSKIARRFWYDVFLASQFEFEFDFNYSPIPFLICPFNNQFNGFDAWK